MGIGMEVKRVVLKGGVTMGEKSILALLALEKNPPHLHPKPIKRAPYVTIMFRNNTTFGKTELNK